MSNFALAYDFTSSDRWAVAPRRKLTTVTVPWKEVPLARIAVPPADGGPARWALVAIIVAMAVAVHGGLVWYVSHHTAARAAVVRKHEVEVQLVQPPKPLPPKVEPPKPPPPKQQVKRQVVPQIQTAVPDTPVVDSTAAEAPVAAAPVAEPPPPPPPAAPEPVTAPFGRAGYLNNPPPEYPKLAARNGWQGTVLLKVRVLSTGQVDTVEVEKSSGFKLLDEEAKATVRSWQFMPSKRGSTPIDGWATVPIEFKLDS
jgi:periplasmic protein TonB